MVLISLLASKETNTNRHSLHLHLSHIQTDMRDVAFYFRKKSGLPKLKDSGLADVLLGGDGLSVCFSRVVLKHRLTIRFSQATIHLESSSDPTTLYDIKNIAVKVDTLKFAIRDSKHDLLYKTLRPLATGLIKKQIQKAVSPPPQFLYFFCDAYIHSLQVADGMRTGLEWLGEELIAVKDRMNEAREGANEEEEVGRFKAMQEVSIDVDAILSVVSLTSSNTRRSNVARMIPRLLFLVLAVHRNSKSFLTRYVVIIQFGDPRF